MGEVKKIDKKIDNYRNELVDLDNKKTINTNDIVNSENELGELKEKFTNNIDNLTIKEAKKKLNNLEKRHITLKKQISEKNENIIDLTHEKDELIKKCLMNLHAKMKKNHRQVNKDHDKYVELYTKAREERHSLERKMMNLKVLVYKNYKIRLV